MNRRGFLGSLLGITIVAPQILKLAKPEVGVFFGKFTKFGRGEDVDGDLPFNRAELRRLKEQTWTFVHDPHAPRFRFEPDGSVKRVYPFMPEKTWEFSEWKEEYDNTMPKV